MGGRESAGRGAALLGEMQEFAGFSEGEQRYICRSLELASGSLKVLKRWSRDIEEAGSIRNQARAYRHLDDLREMDLQDPGTEIMASLIAVTAFDLSEGKLASFAAYRFLYERLLGAAARPWLVSAFCAAAALPYLHPSHRRSLLQSVSDDNATRVGWSNREPTFFPRWVNEVHLPLTA